MKAPAPQHGIGLNLGDDSGGEIWVSGAYDALGLASTDALAKHAVAQTVARLPGLTVISSSRSRLSQLEAADVVLERRDAGGKINYVHFVLAFRPVPRQLGIVYTIGIQAHAKEAATEAAFSEIVNSFRLLGLPK
jgi:hypothetical protein